MRDFGGWVKPREKCGWGKSFEPLIFHDKEANENTAEAFIVWNRIKDRKFFWPSVFQKLEISNLRVLKGQCWTPFPVSCYVKSFFITYYNQDCVGQQWQMRIFLSQSVNKILMPLNAFTQRFRSLLIHAQSAQIWGRAFKCRYVANLPLMVPKEEFHIFICLSVNVFFFLQNLTVNQPTNQSTLFIRR